MATVQSSKSTCPSSSFTYGGRRPATMTVSFHGTGRWSARVTLNVVLFCLIMLIGTPAKSESETGDKLAPRDTVEIRVSGWSALRGGAAEASLLTDAFTIGTAGSLELPFIGHLPAAGLSADELANLIADRLQARSGLPERPGTTVQLKQYAPLDVRGLVARPGRYPYRPNLTVQEAIEAAGGLARIESLAETETQLTLSISRKVGRVRELTGAPNTLVLPGDTIWVRLTPKSELRSARASNGRSSGGPLEHTNFEEHQVAAQPSVAASRAQQHALERERSKADTLLPDLSAARREIEAVRKEAIAARRRAHDDQVRNNQRLAAERQRTAALKKNLVAAHDDLKAVKAQAAQERNAAARAGQAAEVLTNGAHELAARERAKVAALGQDLLMAHREIDALKNRAQTSSDEREKALRRELVSAREELDAMRRAARDASAQARAVADTAAGREQALEEQRQRAQRLARDLTMAQREIASSKANAMLSIRARAAALRARHAAEAALVEERRALDEERQKVRRVERDLAAARQSLDTRGVSVKRASAAQATALLAQQTAEAAAKHAGEALAVQSKRTDTLARDLDAARRERDAAKEEVTLLWAALQQERDRVSGLVRELIVARSEIDDLKAHAKRIKPAPKPRVTNPISPRVGTLGGKRAQPARRSKEIHKVDVRKPLRPVRLTSIALPAALLPTRPPLRAGQGVW
jgi:protein involved in polysaccharide export with SLBB domain